MDDHEPGRLNWDYESEEPYIDGESEQARSDRLIAKARARLLELGVNTEELRNGRKGCTHL